MCSAIRFSACITLPALSSQPTTTGKAILRTPPSRRMDSRRPIYWNRPLSKTLAPGAYTVIVRGKNLATGIGLVELYDLSPLSNSKLKNMSTRGSVGTLDNVLISGFTVGDVGQHDRHCAPPWPIAWSFWCERSAKGSCVNDLRLDWHCHRDQRQLARRCERHDVQKNTLSPPNKQESALVLHLPAGEYTAVVSGADGGTGIGLVEVYSLH